MASGETFSTFPRLSKESGEAEAEAGSRGSFCDKLWQGGDGARGARSGAEEDWIYNMKHLPGAEWP